MSSGISAAGGKTFKRMDSRGSGEISMRRLAADAIEVAEYLRARLHHDRIFLLASSMGSTFGLHAARIRPDLFYAYIGTDQNVGMVRGRGQSHSGLLDRLRAHGMVKGVRTVERIGADATSWTPVDFTAVAQWTMKSDPPGFRRTMKLLKDAVWYAPGWTLGDIRAFVRGMHFSLEQLLPEIVRYDAWAWGTRVFSGAIVTAPIDILYECALYSYRHSIGAGGWSEIRQIFCRALWIC